jgi:type IV pilus assembly protein PilC
MKFNYQARTKKGEIQSGEIEASSKEVAIELLKRKDLYVTFLEKATTSVYSKRIVLFERITAKDLSLFSRQLSVMFKAKVPLIESLDALSSQTKNIDFKEKIMNISEKVEGGVAFSHALSLYPKVFSHFYIAMIKSGEVSGKLSEVLAYLADHLEREHNLGAKAKGALVYPSLVLFVVLLVVTLLMVVVIPKLEEVLLVGGQDLPTPTKIVIATSNFMSSFGWLILLAAVLIGFLLFKYYSTPKGRNFFDSILLKIPAVGKALKMIYLSRFAENISTLTLSGLPIAQSLEIVGDIIGNNAYKKAILKTKDEVRKGEMVSSVLSQFPDLFPPIFVQMVLVGEKTGTLDSTLMSIVGFYQKEVDRSIDGILRLIEPALIAIMGLVVGGIMLAVLMPLYQTISL